MPWVVTIREKVGNQRIEVTPDMVIPADDPMFAEEVHVMPVYIKTEKGEVVDILYGVHDDVRDCVCGPRVLQQAGQRDIVIHNLIN